MAKKAISPAYWATIPADVLYDHGIPDKAKLLYGEISGLCDKKGYCWADNENFAELHDVHPDTISRLLSALSKRGYIRIEMVPTRTGHERRIYAGIRMGGVGKNADTRLDDFADTGVGKNAEGVSAKMSAPNKINRILDNTPLTPHGGKRGQKAEWEPDRFEGLWKFYPVIEKVGPDGSVTKTSKGDKGKARRIWNAMQPSPELIRDMGRWLILKLKYDDQYARGYGVQHVSTWLNAIRRNGGVLEMPEAPQVTQAAQHSAPDDDTPSYQLGGDGCLM